MKAFQPYQEQIDAFLQANFTAHEPHGLYDPIVYILGLGGKRLRPALTIAACELYGGSSVQALPAAAAIEVFHNFTLIHDDIMDEAPLRRGNQTVHQKWGLNTGILSGDAMLIRAYQLLESYEPSLQVKLLKRFNQTALEVCEGQQFDVEFENREVVSEEDYLKMIQYKTAVLVGAALNLGAWIGGASDDEALKLYQFGLELGTAFQIQDDYLDAFGNPENFGKTVGGDILENKKTLLYIRAFAAANPTQKARLKAAYAMDSKTLAEEKVEKVKSLFQEFGAKDQVLESVKEYTHRALKLVEEIRLSDQGKQLLVEFAHSLMVRNL